ncbi:hypothetical protein P5673_004199 [Acropora cervicornis]|uniref:Uncharacterized protein n=1 Tax=Acropora cervicornis TaxID=6130 RepID=A0AAD9R0A6_ACRCE|nr:hypothetical protein P5673_004199 [Acropora cervicornis]
MEDARGIDGYLSCSVLVAGGWAPGPRLCGNVGIFRYKPETLESKDGCLSFGLFLVAANNSRLELRSIDQNFEQELLVVGGTLIKNQGVVRKRPLPLAAVFCQCRHRSSLTPYLLEISIYSNFALKKKKERKKIDDPFTVTMSTLFKIASIFTYYHISSTLPLLLSSVSFSSCNFLQKAVNSAIVFPPALLATLTCCDERLSATDDLFLERDLDRDFELDLDFRLAFLPLERDLDCLFLVFLDNFSSDDVVLL